MAQDALRTAAESLLDAVEEMTELTSWVCELAIKYGMKEDGSNVTNAKRYLVKLLSQQEETQTNLKDLPTVFHKIPKIWLVGRASTRRTPGFTPLRLSVAQREHKQLVPLLLEAWPMADEESRDIMVKEYLRSSAEDFKQQVYNFIYENEETTLEEELIDTISAQVARERFEDWSDSNAVARARKNTKR